MSVVSEEDSSQSAKKKCIVCKSSVNLFKFPTVFHRAILWLRLVGIKNFPKQSSFPIFLNNARVCCLHFDEHAFANCSRTKLFPGALPSRKIDCDGEESVQNGFILGSNTKNQQPPETYPDVPNNSSDSSVMSEKSPHPHMPIKVEPTMPCSDVYPVKLFKAADFPTENSASNVTTHKPVNSVFSCVQLLTAPSNAQHYVMPSNFQTNDTVRNVTLQKSCDPSNGVQPLFLLANTQHLTKTPIFLAKDGNMISQNSSDPTVSSSVQPLFLLTNAGHLAAPTIFQAKDSNVLFQNSSSPLTTSSIQPLSGISNRWTLLQPVVRPSFKTKGADSNVISQYAAGTSLLLKNQDEVKSSDLPQKSLENSIQPIEQKIGEPSKPNSDWKSSYCMTSTRNSHTPMNRFICVVCKTDKKPLFRFPKDKKYLGIWLKQLKMDSYQKEDYKYIYSNARICPLHFQDSCFTSTLNNRLHKFSTPTIIDVNLLENREPFSKRTYSKGDRLLQKSSETSSSSKRKKNLPLFSAMKTLLRLLKDKLTAEQYKFLLTQLKVSKMHRECRGWTQEEMSFVLEIHKHSPKAYELLRKYLFFPSNSTLKRFHFDDSKLEKFVQNMESEDSELSQDSELSEVSNPSQDLELSEDSLSGSDNQEDTYGTIIDKAPTTERLPKITEVKSLAHFISTEGSCHEPTVAIKQECPSPEFSDDETKREKRKILINQIQCHIEASQRKCELLQQRSKKLKQRNSRFPVILMLAREIVKDR